MTSKYLALGLLALTAFAAHAQAPIPSAAPAARPSAPAQKPPPAAAAQTPAGAPKAAAEPAANATKATAVPKAAAAAAPKDISPERLAIQSDLAWTGFYNGAINGEASDRLAAAIKAFQKDQGAAQSGTLSAPERTALAAAAKVLQDDVGWKLVTDPASGMRVGIPAKLVPTQVIDPNAMRWASSTGTIQIVISRRTEAGVTSAIMADREKKYANRKLSYSAVRPDFYVLSGLQGLKKFYVRGQIRGDDVRTMTILYDQATEGTMEPVVIAMSGAFVPFAAAGTMPLVPPVRRKVEYATGVVVGVDGSILTAADAIDECQIITIGGYGNADRVAVDKAAGLALLRIYGATGLKPLPPGGASAKPAVTLTGIADPQTQAGGAAVSSMAAQISSTGADAVLTPAPALGFLGASATDADGRFAGIVLQKSVVLAGVPAAMPASQAALAPAELVRGFLKTNGVTTDASVPADPKASVVRVICVRK